MGRPSMTAKFPQARDSFSKFEKVRTTIARPRRTGAVWRAVVEPASHRGGRNHRRRFASRLEQRDVLAV